MVFFARRTLLTWATNYLTRKLNETPNLEARIGGLELGLLRGEVTLRRIYVAKLSKGRKLLEARCADVSIQLRWRDLLHGNFVGRVSLHDPVIQIRDGSSTKEKKSSGSQDALLDVFRQMKRLPPFRLHLVKVMGGRVEYVSQHTTPPFQLTLGDVSISALNLTNIEDPKVSGAAHFSVEGRTTGNGQFWLKVVIPSLTGSLTFDLQAGLQGVNLVDLNDLLRAYAKFDVKRGVCSIYSEFAVENGHYKGRVEPQFKDLDVFAWHKEHSKGFLQICRQAVIALVANIFKNRPRDELALNIDISGTFEDADVDIWSAIGSLLGNAFRRSFLSRDEPPPPTDIHAKKWLHFLPWKATTE